MAILFYATGQDWDIFSNVVSMLPIEVVIGDEHYSSTSTEGIFQAMKYIAPDGGPIDLGTAKQKMTMNAGAAQQAHNKRHRLWDNLTPGGTAWIPDPNTLYNVPGDHDVYPTSQEPLSIKERLMYDLIKMKATQHLSVMKALLTTGTQQIIEDTSKASYDDNFWGNGKNGGPARNALGKLWMMLRDEITTEFAQGHTIPVMAGISDGVCHALRIKQSAVVTDNNKHITYQMVDPTQWPIWNKAADIHAHAQASWPTLGADIDAALLTKGIQPAPAPAQPAYDPWMDPTSAHNGVLSALQSKPYGYDITTIKVGKSNDGKNRDIFKVYFKNQSEAQNFADTHKRYNDPSPPLKHTATGFCLILGAVKVGFIVGGAIAANAISEATKINQPAIHTNAAPIAAAHLPVLPIAAPSPVATTTVAPDPYVQLRNALQHNFGGVKYSIEVQKQELTLTPPDIHAVIASFVALHIQYTQIGNILILKGHQATLWATTLGVSGDIFANTTIAHHAVTTLPIGAPGLPFYPASPLPQFPPQPTTTYQQGYVTQLPQFPPQPTTTYQQGYVPQPPQYPQYTQPHVPYATTIQPQGYVPQYSHYTPAHIALPQVSAYDLQRWKQAVNAQYPGAGGIWDTLTRF